MQYPLCFRVAALLAPSILAGCGSITSVETGAQGRSASAVDSRVSANYANIGLTVEEVRLVPTRGGVHEAQVDIRNARFGRNAFAHRFEWVDANGGVIDSRTSTWSVVTVESGGRTTIRSVAPSPGAEDFRLQLKDAD